MNNETEYPEWVRKALPGPPRLVGECGPLIVLDEAAISPEAKERFIRELKEWATQPMQMRAVYSDRPQVHRVRCDWFDSVNAAIATQMSLDIDRQILGRKHSHNAELRRRCALAIAKNMAKGIPRPLINNEQPPKLYRVFYDCGVYEWYVNDGRAPLWHYRKHGTLAGAYNVSAGICAPRAV